MPHITRQVQSWHNQETLRFMVKIIKEIIPAGTLRPHVNHCVTSCRDDLLKMQIAAFELRNDRIEIPDVDGDGSIGRGMKLRRFEFMVLHGERQGDRIVRATGIRTEQQCATEQQKWQIGRAHV